MTICGVKARSVAARSRAMAQTPPNSRSLQARAQPSLCSPNDAHRSLDATDCRCPETHKPTNAGDRHACRFRFDTSVDPRSATLLASAERAMHTMRDMLCAGPIAAEPKGRPAEPATAAARPQISARPNPRCSRSLRPALRPVRSMTGADTDCPCAIRPRCLVVEG